MDTNTAFLAYGVHVSNDSQEADRIDTILPAITDRCPDVQSAAGGSNQGEEIFLVAYSAEVQPGGHLGTAGISPEQQAGWDLQLADAIRVLGYTGLQRPAWLCFTEES